MDVNRKNSNKAGLPPGTLVHLGKKHNSKVKVTVIDYDKTEFTHKEWANAKDCYPFKDKKSVSWINIDGLHDIETISEIGQHFELHPLLLEDVLNTSSRPKIEEFDNCIFLTLKMLGINTEATGIISEQVSLVFGKNWVISFQEQEGDIFDALRERIEAGKGPIRGYNVDYLVYRLIDIIVDNYFFVSEYLSDSIQTLEEEVMESPEKESLKSIQTLKRQLIEFKKSVVPLREIITNLKIDADKYIGKHTARHLQDVYEHILHLNDNIDTQRDILAGIVDLYHSSVSQKMNQIMQVLTIISTIFIPLTFIAGIYGMNFDNIPELHWRYGYFAVWGIMAIIIILMIAYFKRKKWL